MEVSGKSNTERGKALARNTLIITFGTFLPKVLSVITLPIITACLTKSEYGTYDLICVLESLFLPCVTLQIQAAAFRFLIEVRDNEQKKTSIITNVLFFVMMTSLIALLICILCVSKYSLELKLLVICFFLFDIIKSAEQQIARGLSSNISYSVSSVLYSVINVLVVFVCLYCLSVGLTGVVLSLMLASFGSTIYLTAKLRLFKYFNLRQISLKTIKEMLSYSWPMIPNSLSLWVMNLSNRLVIIFFLGIEANAIFAVANKLPSLFSVVQSTFTLAWQENASIVSKDDDAGLYYSKMFDTIYRLMVGVMALLIAATPVLFSVLIKGDYLAAYNQIPLLFIGVFYNVIVAFLGGIYVAMKATKSVGLTSIGSAIINVFISVLLIKFIGLYAASISIVVSYLFLAFYRMKDIQKYVKIQFKYKRIVTSSLILLVMCIMCFQRNTIMNWLNVVLSVCTFIGYNYDMVSRFIKISITKFNAILR